MLNKIDILFFIVDLISYFISKKIHKSSSIVSYIYGLCIKNKIEKDGWFKDRGVKF